MTVLADGFDVWLAGGKNLQAVLANVKQAMDELSEATVKHTLGGALTGAQNEGRLATAEQTDAVGLVVASEILDKATCKPCAKIHGKILGNTNQMDQVREHYPGGGFGGYRHCDGRERCRGMIRIKWQAQAVPPGAPKLTPEQLAEPASFEEAARQMAEEAAGRVAEQETRRPSRPVVQAMPDHTYSEYTLTNWRDRKWSLSRTLPRAGEEMQVHDRTEGPLVEWSDGLTETQRTAVRSYTTSIYLPMNAAMAAAGGTRDRAQLADRVGELPDHLKGRIPERISHDDLAGMMLDLWDALDAHPLRAEPVQVFRGEHPDQARGYNPRAVYEGLSEGQEFEVSAFVSTSLQEAVSEGFTGRTWEENQRQSVMMSIRTRTGANVIGVHTMGDAEAEVVLPPNTRFRVVKAFDPETQKIELEVIDDE